jgi:hypothetical protein
MISFLTQQCNFRGGFGCPARVIILKEIVAADPHHATGPGSAAVHAGTSIVDLHPNR